MRTQKIKDLPLTEKEGIESLGERKGSYRRWKVDRSKRTTELENTLRHGDPEASSSELRVNGLCTGGRRGGRTWSWSALKDFVLKDRRCFSWQVTGYTTNSGREGCELKGLTQPKQWWASELRWRPQEYRREGKSSPLGRWCNPKTCYPDVDTNPAEF